MLILPIKRKWLEMIRSGKKREEYRAISPYYTSRFKAFLPHCCLNNAAAEKIFRKATAERIRIEFRNVVLRAGYDPLAPATMISGKITVGPGCAEWGAVKGEEYYILHIEKMEDLITDAKSYTPEHVYCDILQFNQKAERATRRDKNVDRNAGRSRY